MTARSEQAATSRGVASRRSPSNALGMLVVTTVLTTSGLGMALSLSQHVAMWLVGQALLAIAFLQWFIVLHEAGHLTLFSTRALNIAAGHVAGFLALIPFAAWRRVHALHHVWTGWQDKDPTTAQLAPRHRGKLTVALTDIAWRWWLPLISIAYRLQNYWNLRRLWTLFHDPRQRRAMVANVLALVGAYGAVAAILGIDAVIELFALALVLSFVLQDPLILSQHTHVPQRLSQGRRVVPLSASEQATHTRSLRFPRWIAQWVLFNFNAHELHHRLPSVPGYRLAEAAMPQPNEIEWWLWLREAKRLRGSVFVFQSRNETGFLL